MKALLATLLLASCTPPAQHRIGPTADLTPTAETTLAYTQANADWSEVTHGYVEFQFRSNGRRVSQSKTRCSATIELGFMLGMQYDVSCPPTPKDVEAFFDLGPL